MSIQFEKQQQNQTVANKLVFVQISVTVSIALVLWIFWGTGVALSAMLGGLICSVATWLMARIMFARGNANPGQMLTAFYLGEAAKVLVTVICFVLAFVLLELNAPAFILTYIAMLLLHWLALLKININN